MKGFRVTALFVVLFCTVLVSELYSQDKITYPKSKEVFGSLDRDGDGKISREEWEGVDKNKNNRINKKEWERFHFKSGGKVDGWKTIGWYDFNNDGFMDKEEYMYNFRNIKR